MKALLTFIIFGAMVLPAFAGSTRTTTTTSSYEETASEPVMNSDMDMDSGASSDMIQAEEYDDSLSTDEVDQARWDEQRMEERNQNSSNIIESEEAVDYTDRTRTNRARKALNTGSDASDDE